MNSPSDSLDSSPAERFSQFVQDCNAAGHPVQLVSAPACQSLDALAVALHCAVADLYKTVCLNYKENDGKRVLVSVVVPAVARVDLQKISDVLGIPVNKIKSAQPDFIAQETGFVPGGIPPFGYTGRRLVDESIFTRQVVCAGGGNNTHEYSRFSPTFLRHVHPDIVVDSFH
ncbi:MAG: YbaK/EbsC family protein [Candidatus Gracilibacteria bacterium]